MATSNTQQGTNQIPQKNVIQLVSLQTVSELTQGHRQQVEGAIFQLGECLVSEINKCVSSLKETVHSSHVVDSAQGVPVETFMSEIQRLDHKLDSVQSEITSMRSLLCNVHDDVRRYITPMNEGSTPGEWRNSDSAIADQHSQILIEPFVSVQHDGEEHQLRLSKVTRDALLGCRVLREVVRRILLHFHSISDLRKFTLTGHTCDAKEGTKDPKEQLPPLHVKFSQAVVLRLFPVNDKLQQITNDDGTTAYDEKIQNLKTDTRKAITSILEYYSSNYDSEGRRIRKFGQKRKPTQEEDRVISPASIEG
ncbi:unnamed protein product [Allacma fusca]|uniref:Uncharacterized protein n=1 Tax=Allacma fusca TaxID=39272 RepID=A0A8J2KQU1_9HEXA|nr:unnamed protein product [Allacma fusca]